MFSFIFLAYGLIIAYKLKRVQWHAARLERSLKTEHTWLQLHTAPNNDAIPPLPVHIERPQGPTEDAP